DAADDSSAQASVARQSAAKEERIGRVARMRSSFRLPRVYPITDTRVSGLSHAEQVARLAAGGATVVQLRDKHAPPLDFYEQAKAAIEVARQHGVQLIINDRVDIALAVGAGGVHLGQDDLPPE